MTKLLNTPVASDPDPDEAVLDVGSALGESLAGDHQPPTQEGPHPPDATAIPSTHSLLGYAFFLARELAATESLDERIPIYEGVSATYKREGRRVLNIAASHWPELMPMVNGELEWVALFSVDLD